MNLRALIAAIVIAAPFEVFSQDISSANFLRSNICGKEDQLACTTWIVGALKGFEIQAAITKSKLFFCKPNGVTYGQQMEVFKKYMQDNPQVLHEDAALLLYFSQVKAFPCSN